MVVQFAPGLTAPAKGVAGHKSKYSGTKIQELDFTKEGCEFDLDELERRQKLAIMLSAIERKNRPWCPHCNIRKVSRNSKDPSAPLDSMCGLCAAKCLEDPKGARRDMSNWT